MEMYVDEIWDGECLELISKGWMNACCEDRFMEIVTIVDASMDVDQDGVVVSRSV
jgi:hypothetical protein